MRRPVLVGGLKLMRSGARLEWRRLRMIFIFALTIFGMRGSEGRNVGHNKIRMPQPTQDRYRREPLNRRKAAMNKPSRSRFVCSGLEHGRDFFRRYALTSENIVVGCAVAES